MRIKSFFCLQRDDANKENLVQTEMMPTMPKSAQFFGFQCKFDNLAEAKRKLKNLYPDAASIVFLSSRPNQTGLNGGLFYKGDPVREVYEGNSAKPAKKWSSP